MQKRVSGGGPMPRTLYDVLNTLFYVAKKNTFEQRYIGDLYTRASENASEKSAKKLVRGSLLSKEHRDRTKK